MCHKRGEDEMDLSRIGPLTGCLSSIFFTLSWIISAMLWGDWELGANSLSDIGICGVDSAEIVFNMGCLVTGFLVIFPGIYLVEKDNKMFRISGCAALVCSIACAGIGVITEDYGDMHNLIASIYAIFAATFIAFSAAGDYQDGYRWFTALAAVLLLLSGIMSISQPFAVFEPIAISCILIWTFVQSALMLYQNMREGVSGTGH